MVIEEFIANLVTTVILFGAGGIIGWLLSLHLYSFYQREKERRKEESEIVQKLRKGELKRGDILIQNFGYDDHYRIILDNNIKEERIEHATLCLPEELNAMNSRDLDKITVTIGRLGKEQTGYDDLDRRRQVWSYKPTCRLCIQIKMTQDNRRMDHWRKWGQVEEVKI